MQAKRPETGDLVLGRWVLLATIVASSMAFIDSTALNVTLPALQADLQATGSQLLWVVNAYQLLLSALILVGGSLGDRYGRRKVFLTGVALFAAASTACGLAPSAELLIAARAVQGTGGALMVPGSLAIISAAFSDERRGQAIGTWSAFTTVTTILGPVLGGYLSSLGLWRAVFFINVPLAIVVVMAAARGVPESHDEQAGALDGWGTLLIVLGLAGVTYGAIEAPGRSLQDPIVAISLLAGVVSLVVFLPLERRSRSPIVPLNLFQSTTFSGSNLLTLLLYSALSGAFFFLPLTLIQAHGYQSSTAGVALLPFSILLASLSRWSGGMVKRTGARLLLVVGPATTSLGFLLLAIPGLTRGPAEYWTSFLPGVVISGLGMGLTVAPLTTTVMGSVPDHSVGAASGINNAVARTAGVLAVAILGGLALVFFKSSLVGQARQLGSGQQVLEALELEAQRLGEASVPEITPPGEQAQIQLAIDRSLVGTFRLVAVICSGLAAASAVAGALWIEGPSLKDGLRSVMDRR